MGVGSGIGVASGDDRTNLLDRSALRIDKQMRVSACRHRIGVTKQRADQWQRSATARQLACERVPQIMNAQALDDASGTANLFPIAFDLDAVTGLTVTGKHVGAISIFCRAAISDSNCRAGAESGTT